MSTISDFIVYIWLLPVVAQILIPLAMFVVYTVYKLYKGVVRSEKAMSEKIAGISNSAVKDSL